MEAGNVRCIVLLDKQVIDARMTSTIVQTLLVKMEELA